ncbi:MAG: yacL, partial [Chlamydiia bacterium]|nr:yacL [Chlamydiia bacterium]
MERNNLFYRLVFFFISCLVTTMYEFSITSTDPINTFLIGFSKGALIFALISLAELAFKNSTLRAFNTTLVGIAIGTLMGYVAINCVHTLFTLLGTQLKGEANNFLTLTTYLASLYLGLTTTYASAEVWWLSIPFVQLSPAGQAKKREILLDISAIEDIRLTDLARLGILDHQLVIPTFVVKEVQKGMEAQDEATKTRYRKCFEQIKRLENMQTLGLQQKEFHISELDDLPTKLLRTAKLVQAHILTSEQNSMKIAEEEGVTIISIEGIANAIKPSAQRGEILSIKIQRPGKEPKQGVGYLEDGTMVVVNGGGEFLGETIKTQVLSQKYSSSGKIIFCNAIPHDEKGTP